MAGHSRFQLSRPQRRALGILLLVLALAIVLMIPLLALTSLGAHGTGVAVGKQARATATSTPLALTPAPTLPPLLTPQGPPPAITAASAMLLDADSGRILADVHGETPHPMASTTKIMTALIAIQTADLNQLITVHEDAVREVQANAGSSADLKAGEVLSLHDLLYALLLPSGDDAALAIADGLAGSPANFVRLMNLFAFRLHLFQTHYATPDGLPAADQYTTAFDLVRLASYAMQLPLFAQIVQTRTYSIAATATHAAHVWSNTNLLLQSYEGATGIKTGYTGEAGYCLVFSATRHGHHLIGALLDAPGSEQRFSDAQKLLDWGFQLPLLPPGPSSPPPI